MAKNRGCKCWLRVNLWNVLITIQRNELRNAGWLTFLCGLCDVRVSVYQNSLSWTNGNSWGDDEFIFACVESENLEDIVVELSSKWLDIGVQRCPFRVEVITSNIRSLAFGTLVWFGIIRNSGFGWNDTVQNENTENSVTLLKSKGHQVGICDERKLV